MGYRLFLIVSVLAAMGCDDDTDPVQAPPRQGARDRGPAVDALVSTDARVGPDAQDDDGLSVDAGAQLDVGPRDTGPRLDMGRTDGDIRAGDGGLICGDFNAEADGSVRPVDIVWIIDASPSMDEEIARIEANLNAWAARIAASGLDYRVVVIGPDREYCSDGRCYFEICVPPPLSGAADCPDTDSATYRHVRTGVHSGDGLDVAIATVDQWQPFLRPGAGLHVVMVTDDDQGWGTDADDFAAFLNGLGMDAVFHSIVDEIGRLPNCGLFDEPPCSCGEERGATYIDLSERTGGVVHSVCQDNWDPIFAALELAVVDGAGIPCAFDLPVLPEGLGFETDRVNVDLIFADRVDPLANVENAAACGAEPGWYYDDPDTPTRVVLCPVACTSGANAVQVEFGCEIRKR